MTVVVGILNKKGVAIAADSATTNDMKNNSTGEKEKKVVNSGNKMLRLSDKMPIAIMIVDSAQLVGLPWDVIIRWYRKQLGDRLFRTVEETAKDFLQTIEKQPFFIEACQSSKSFYETHLVFAGYGAQQDYPQLVDVEITGISQEEDADEEGNFIMKYSIKGEFHSPFTISDEQPSAICYFGQTDIAAALTDDATKNDELKVFCLEAATVLRNNLKELADKGKFSIDDIPETVSYQKGFLSVFQQDNEESHQQWLDAIKHYTLQEMAALAKNLINFTELYHKLMCLDESVGGLIDLAVITLEDSFQWLNRKSWYDPSRGGQYGKFGI